MSALAKFRVGPRGTTTRKAIVGLMERYRARGARADVIFPCEGCDMAYLEVDGPLADPRYRGVRDDLVLMGGEPVEPILEGIQSSFPEEPLGWSTSRALPFSD